MPRALSAIAPDWWDLEPQPGSKARPTTRAVSAARSARPSDSRSWRAPPAPQDYRKLGTRVVELHPLTLIQNARTLGGGNIPLVPTRALTAGPVQSWRAQRVSISLRADHPHVRLHFYRGGIGPCQTQMRCSGCWPA